MDEEHATEEVEGGDEEEVVLPVAALSEETLKAGD